MDTRPSALFHSSLVSRAAFTDSSFEPLKYVDSIVQRAVDPGIAGLRSKRGAPLDPLSTEEACKISHDVVDALSDALEAVTALRASESDLRDRCLKDCSVTEADEKTKLSKVRSRADETAARLRELEAQLTAAASVTAGVEQLLEIAAAKSSRGKIVLQVVGYFEDITRVPPPDLARYLEQLSGARAEARQRVCHTWKRYTGRDVQVTAEAFFTLEEANGGLVMTHERLVAEAGVPMEICSRAATPAAIELLKKLSQLTASGLEKRVPNVENLRTITSWTAAELVKDLQCLLESFYELYEAISPTSGAIEGTKAVPSNPPTPPPPTVSTPSTPQTAPVAEVMPPPPMHSEAGNTDEGPTRGLGRARGRTRFGRVRGGRQATSATPDEPPQPADTASDAKPLAPAPKLASRGFRRSAPAAASAQPSNIDAARERDPSAPQTMLSEQDITGPYSRQLLASMDLIARLYTNLTGTSEPLVDYYVEQTLGALSTDVSKSFLFAPLPPLPGPDEPFPTTAMDMLSSNEACVKKLVDFLSKRLRRESLVYGALFNGNERVRHEILRRTIESLLRSYVIESQQFSGNRREAALKQDALLGAAQKRRNALRLLDAEYYHLSLYATLYKYVVLFAEQLPQGAVHPLVLVASGKMVADSVHATTAMASATSLGSMAYEGRRRQSNESDAAGELSYLLLAQRLFSQRDAYTESGVELQLYRRHCDALKEEYHRQLLPPNQGPYDLTEAHSAKYLHAVRAAEKAVWRITLLVPEASQVVQIKTIATALAAFIISFVKDELQKCSDSLRADVPQWSRKPLLTLDAEPTRDPRTPQTEGEASPFGTREAHHAASRIILWAQQAISSLLRFVDLHLAPQYSKDPALQVEMDVSITNELQPLNEAATSIVTMIAHAVVTRSLAYLMHYQKRDEYNKNSKMALDAVSDLERPTKAAQAMTAYLKFQFEALKDIIAAFSAGADTTAIPADSDTPALTKPLSSTRAAAGMSTTPRSAEGPLQDVPATEIAAASLSTVTTGAVSALGGMSFARLVSTGLYRGITAHFRSLVVNDEGALLFKRDVALYREAITSLTAACTSAVDKRAVEMQFDTIREVANLILMPLDNIKVHKSTTNLRYLHQKEITAFLRMRADMRSALRQADGAD